MTDFDFDAMAKLAKSDPAEFDRQTKQLLADEISKGSEWQQAKSRRLLKEFEAEAARTGDRLVAAANMLHANTQEMVTELTHLQQAQTQLLIDMESIK